jgi:hypothetical protein
MDARYTTDRGMEGRIGTRAGRWSTAAAMRAAIADSLGIDGPHHPE